MSGVKRFGRKNYIRIINSINFINCNIHCFSFLGKGILRQKAGKKLVIAFTYLYVT